VTSVDGVRATPRTSPGVYRGLSSRDGVAALLRDDAALLTLLRTKEAIEHILNVVDMALFNVLAGLEVITEDRRTGTTHDAQLPAEVGQVLQLR
jgi:hypothetical protein